MALYSDQRGKPGDFVMPRGGKPLDIWNDPDIGKSSAVARRVGQVLPSSLGLIISTHATGWTYVLWSMPYVAGWIQDGFLRPMKVKT